MLESTDARAICAKKPITAEQIVKDIMGLDNPRNIREDLHEMMLSFFMFNDEADKELKTRVYCTYITLYEALKKMEHLNR